MNDAVAGGNVSDGNSHLIVQDDRSIAYVVKDALTLQGFDHANVLIDNLLRRQRDGQNVILQNRSERFWISQQCLDGCVAKLGKRCVGWSKHGDALCGSQR